MLRRVRLELARCHEFPEGSATHGYELSLPLARDGTLDRVLWRSHRKESEFRRFWGEEDEARGHLMHRGERWMLVFDGEDVAEAIFKPDSHRFVTGGYVSIKERDGAMRTFRITSVA